MTNLLIFNAKIVLKSVIKQQKSVIQRNIMLSDEEICYNKLISKIFIQLDY